MRVAIPFHLRGKTSGLNDKVQEFNIDYDPAQNDLNKLIDFINEFPEHQINIQYRNGIDTKSAAALAKISDNVRFCLRAEDIGRIPKLKENGCKYFYNSYCACNCWMMLYRLVEQEDVSEVYICDDLCYEMDKVRFYCDTHNVRIRTIVNRVPVTRPVSPDMFFIQAYRPQDMPVLDRYYHTVEFYNPKDSHDTHFFDVMYRVFIEKQDWYGDLRELNPDVPFEYPCRSTLPRIAAKRCICGLACLRGGNCRTCEHIVKLAQDLKDSGAQFDPKVVKSV